MLPLFKIKPKVGQKLAHISVPQLFDALVHDKCGKGAASDTGHLAVVIADIEDKGTNQAGCNLAFGSCSYFFNQCGCGVQHNLEGNRCLFAFDQLEAEWADVLPTGESGGQVTVCQLFPFLAAVEVLDKMPVNVKGIVGGDHSLLHQKRIKLLR